MKFITPLFTLLAMLSLCSCNNNKDKTGEAAENKNDNSNTAKSSTPAPVFDKLVGTWQKEDGKSFERWTKNENGSFAAVAFSVKGTDTSWDEQAKIYPEGSNWVFENVVKGQNNGQSVKFTSSQMSDNSVQFSNPAHDFPTDINYTVPDANTVNAFIIGPNSKGGKDTIPFNYQRLQ